MAKQSFKMNSFGLIALLLCPPIISFAQPGDVEQATIDAKKDATHHKPWDWFYMSLGASCLMNCIGGGIVILASQITPSAPPTHRLIGKSPEYKGS